MTHVRWEIERAWWGTGVQEDNEKLERLLAEGWEPFAVVSAGQAGAVYHFRRPTQFDGRMRWEPAANPNAAVLGEGRWIEDLRLTLEHLDQACQQIGGEPCEASFVWRLRQALGFNGREMPLTDDACPGSFTEPIAWNDGNSPSMVFCPACKTWLPALSEYFSVTSNVVPGHPKEEE
jgi:hypothetical protein